LVELAQTAHQFSFNALGGGCDIDVVGIERPDALIQLAVVEVRRIEAKFSRYIDSSIVGRINSQAGVGWVACDEETIGLLDYANTLYEHSNGLFDITSGVMRRVWNFEKNKIPAPGELKKILALIGWSKFERKGNQVRLKKAGMQIDLGGFGKEYAVDRVAAIFLENGVSSALINFGGDVRALGTKPDGLPWQIGIQDPRQLDKCFAALNLSQGALATSGDYERFFEIDGKRYCHILNPKTGMPVSYWRSVTVLAPLTSAAGATTTIAMLLQEQGLNYLQNSGFAFLAVDHAGEVFKGDQTS
jgi:thiamine biosynthesis lipoprotein